MRELCTFLLVFCVPSLCAGAEDFHKAVERAAQNVTLAALDGHPFHLKLDAKDTCRGVESQRCDSIHEHPEYDTEIEVWWAAPDKWRREVKSAAFSQTAIQNGQHYSETNSSDYLPWWLHELITEALTPIPLDELRDVNPDWNGKCAKWSSEFKNGHDVATAWSSICINSDGTVPQVLARTASVLLSDYRSFDKKLIARSITLWPQGIIELKGRVTLLEPLSSDEKLFVVAEDTALSARVRFVTLREADLHDFELSTPQPVWPVIHNFPNKGVMTVNIRIGRDGNIREIGQPISINNAVIDAGVEQLKKWKFKPYLVDGFPVEVNTNLVIPFEAEVAIPQANGVAYVAAPALERFNKAQQLSDLRTKDGKAFHMTATLHAGTASKPFTGSYEEIWISQTMWRREIKLGATSLVESQDANRMYRKVDGAEATRSAGVFGLLFWDLPKTDDTFHEADWRQTLVKLNNTDSLRIARGEENAQGELTNAVGYWFDPTSGELLQQYRRGAATSEGYVGITIGYGNVLEWNGKRIPRRIEVLNSKGGKVLDISLDNLETTPARDESFFVLQGVQPHMLPEEKDQ